MYRRQKPHSITPKDARGFSLSFLFHSPKFQFCLLRWGFWTIYFDLFSGGNRLQLPVMKIGWVFSLLSESVGIVPFPPGFAFCPNFLVPIEITVYFYKHDIKINLIDACHGFILNIEMDIIWMGIFQEAYTLIYWRKQHFSLFTDNVFGAVDLHSKLFKIGVIIQQKIFLNFLWKSLAST